MSASAAEDVAAVTAPRPVGLYAARALTLGPVALAFPVASAAVFGFGTDRNATADLLAVVYSFGLFLGFTTSFWPLPGLRSWTRFERIESCALIFMIVSYITHLSWEFVWLLFHDAIIVARDSAWAYPWWAYVDGGDLRYASPTSTLITMEILSVTNGVVGAAGLTLWLRSGRTDRRGVLLCMATGVVHLYSASLYFLGEIIEGMPNVDTASFLDTWIKFGLANAPWVVFPWVVLYWGQRRVLGSDEG
jgi:hypothetical protein